MELHRRPDGALSGEARHLGDGEGGGGGPPPPALALEEVSRRFGATVALDRVTMRVRPGTVHALLGENGAGKSTLVNVAFGHVRPDAGRVLVDGRERRIASPADAMRAGLGMVHQHFALVPAMTVAENVALGRRGRHDLRRVAEAITRVGDETGLRVDPRALVGHLGVAAQQRVEIVKALTRGARVLMLDEPTAVLAPREAEALLAWVRHHVARGGSAVLITHKLREALAVADELTVLRRGEWVLHGPATAMDEARLLAAMVGRGLGGPPRDQDAVAEPAERDRFSPREGESLPRRDEDGSLRPGERAVAASIVGVPPRHQDRPGSAMADHRIDAADIVSPPPRPPSRPPSRTSAPASTPAAAPGHAGETHARVRPVVLRLDGVSYRDERGVLCLRDASLVVHAGELLGVAAVEGAGHHELLRILAGRLSPTTGRADLPAEIGFVSEDRHRDALALDLSLTENVVLRGAGRRRGRIAWRTEAARTERIIAEHEVRAAGADAPARALSGGNQQKLVLGRELWGAPAALVAESPTRGLDVRASAAVLDALRAAAERGAAVVVYSSDLDEILALADRIVVVHAGRLREVPRTREAVGAALVGAVGVEGVEGVTGEEGEEGVVGDRR